MANLSSNYRSRSSSNYYRKNSSGSPPRRSNTQATAYAVEASTMALTGFHFTTSLAGGAVPWGVPSPPPSPEVGPAGRTQRPSLQARRRSGDAACHITEECERLFCETLKTVFLVEKSADLENSLPMDMRNTVSTTTTPARPIPTPQQPYQQQVAAVVKHGQLTPSPSPDGRIYPQTGGLVRDYVEVWDYVAGAGFKGFVAEKNDERTLFIFFSQDVIGMDLKPGLMSLLELATAERFECSKLVIGVDRNATAEEAKDLTRDLGWVGFELTMLDEWAGYESCLSDRWLLLGMEL